MHKGRIALAAVVVLLLVMLAPVAGAKRASQPPKKEFVTVGGYVEDSDGNKTHVTGKVDCDSDGTHRLSIKGSDVTFQITEAEDPGIVDTLGPNQGPAARSAWAGGADLCRDSDYDSARDTWDAYVEGTGTCGGMPVDVDGYIELVDGDKTGGPTPTTLRAASRDATSDSLSIDLILRPKAGTLTTACPTLTENGSFNVGGPFQGSIQHHG